ncbi:MAG: hypothetical protein AAGD14_15490 [Planctomycetota bacterium]
MRRRWFALLPLLIAAAFAVTGLATGTAVADDAKEGVVHSKDLNFEIRLPEDSVDWEVKPIDPDKDDKRLRAHLYTEFADSASYASVHIYAQKMPGSMVRKKIGRIADDWRKYLEGDLENQSDRKEIIEDWAGVETYKAQLKGIRGTGPHFRRWFLTRNGSFLYTIIVNQHGEAVKDDAIKEEIDAILKNFKFLEIRKLKGDRKTKKADAPGGDEGGKSDEGPKGDPEKLKEKKIESSFWRFKAVKPQGMLVQEITDKNAENGIKAYWQGDINNVRAGVRIYAWSLKDKKFTLDKLLESKQKWWKDRVKSSLEPKLNKKYKHGKLTKKGYRAEFIGRSTRRERWIYLLLECKNDRQYQVEIWTMGDTRDKTWGKKIDKFIKSFEPLKK